MVVYLNDAEKRDELRAAQIRSVAVFVVGLILLCILLKYLIVKR